MIADRRRRKPTSSRPLKLAAERVRALAPRAGQRRVAARAGRAVPPHIRRQLRRRRRGFPPHRRLALLLLVLLIVLLGGGWLWLRDSSLASVKRVSVTGAGGPDAGRISSALTTAARRMTTLNFDAGKLRAAVARYPVVADLRVHTGFPDRMAIQVVERVPVGTATVNGRQTAVSADGRLLPDVTAGASLPVLSGVTSARGARLSGAQAGEEVALLAAAPSALISKLSQVSVAGAHGLTAKVRSGPVLYFGDSTGLSAKWLAATEVLGDAGSAGAAYIDVTDPHRPAAGIGPQGAAGAVPSATAGPAPATGTNQPATAGASTVTQGAITGPSGAAATGASAPTSSGSAGGTTASSNSG